VILGYIWRNRGAAARNMRSTIAAMREQIRRQPWCAFCGGTKRLEAHHVTPVSECPEMADDQFNLLTLCRWCHFVVGHLCDWRRGNRSARHICRYSTMAREIGET
jgi:hypothetical protein